HTTSRYLLPAMLNTTRPSRRMPALRKARFTSAGLVHLALRATRYHAISGSKASRCRGLDPNRFSVLRRITRIGRIGAWSQNGTSLIIACETLDALSCSISQPVGVMPEAITPPSDAEVAGRLLAHLRTAFAQPALAYAEVPARVTGGFETSIFR